MVERDCGAAADLCTQLGYPSTPAQVERRLRILEATAGQVVFGAEQDGRLVGWVHVQTRCGVESDPFAEISGLVVDERLRGHGVGRALVDAAEEWARREGQVEVRVRSNSIRTRTHRFYQQLGYALAKTSHVFHKSL
ncbi:MAG: GNAT family N-acetyltransferase [Myxococcales bacterium]